MLSTSSRVANRYAKLSSMLSVSSKKQRKDPKMPRWKIVHTRTADTNRPADTKRAVVYRRCRNAYSLYTEVCPKHSFPCQCQHFSVDQQPNDPFARMLTTDLPRSREWNNCAAAFRLPPIQNSTRGRSFHPSHCETSQLRHGQHISATLPEEMGEVRYSDHPRSRRNGRCLESDTSRQNLIFYRVLHKRF